ncbi:MULTISPECIES: hemolysin family protein [Micromonospora]|uniref:Hemolysin, contains CBS domains n=1 Tax=Micromonospora yangpuensis TaxID=683228 RepID=A0A1C6VGK1_9ACTN|nr:hemolysin family protein [Micromonospora yangpuensis]GGL98891.1 membrane protein [Micromonospora yangpuensis]SCL65421.1 Hemolysin, contains CBS domains [Micromonospora yangpuensis]
MSDVTALLLAVALLIGNAFFVGAEFALISARRTQIEPRAAAGSTIARVTLRAMENVSLMMAGAQLGITVCSLGLGAVGEPAVAHLLERPFAAMGVPDGLLHPIAFAIALVVVVFLHMVLGEMVPKNIALAGPERSALILGPVLYGIVTVLRPLIWLLNQLANAVLRLLRVTPKDEVASAFTSEEVAGFISQSRQEGLLDQQEHDLLTGALSFNEQTAEKVALPLSSLVTVAQDSTPVELEEQCASTGFSRFPTTGPDGTLTGYVHVKDILGVPDEDRDRPVDRQRIRDLATVDAGQPLRDVLAVMQQQGAHLARVVEPGTDRLLGLAALEDVIEELVGEVRDATQRVPEPARA